MRGLDHYFTYWSALLTLSSYPCLRAGVSSGPTCSSRVHCGVTLSGSIITWSYVDLLEKGHRKFAETDTYVHPLRTSQCFYENSSFLGLMILLGMNISGGLWPLLVTNHLSGHAVGPWVIRWGMVSSTISFTSTRSEPPAFLSHMHALADILAPTMYVLIKWR